MSKKILITGANGYIGKILSEYLENKGYETTKLDLPKGDVRVYDIIKNRSKNHYAIIHLAWNTIKDNYLSGDIDPDNYLMIKNVYDAAIENKIRKVIVASSIHADSPFDMKEGEYLDPYRLPIPDSPYGAGKCFMEILGRYYAYHKGLEVVSVRIGGVSENTKENKERQKTFPCYKKPKTINHDAVWISPEDLCNLFYKIIIHNDKINNNFAIIYAVGNNKNRIHSIENPFGWKPKEGV